MTASTATAWIAESDRDESVPKQPQVIRTPEDMHALSAQVRAGGKRIALVPTMGALHAGHLSLVDHARGKAEFLVVSIFVNPLQFDRDADLDAYPRTWEADYALCAEHGVDAIYAPTAPAMYPDGFATKVSVSGLGAGLCGAHRPGHFDGVTTVVAKLFGAVMPHLAVFGQKDYQQLKIVQRMAADLNMDIEVEGRPTLREADGLAMSSRNVHLSPAQREQALCLRRALDKAQELARAGERDVEKIKTAAARLVEGVPEARLEYLEVVDAENLAPLAKLEGPARMALAVWLGATRLIDNDDLN
ncbi:MAG: pantoate--beta-alanine ligase [Proteobacteria bacterium]|nr:pantoate--beta-alanine ligase [Pseudomonadota bacterium]MBU1452000.1 pantoate--beta-alanine ligase [Pseudomonadota bacterium]MBU2467492.1 pantoate--beta-alanine ligase [Pseudomonadota bacterium]MBU2517715.1 pantoate--beta-alanine ligase [Pseudomonadota bacterium]